MFKIKSLQYKDLILNSTGCRKSNQLLRQPLFSFKRLVSGVRRYRVICSTFGRYRFERRISEEPAFRTSLTLIRARARTLRGAPRGRRYILQRADGIAENVDFRKCRIRTAFAHTLLFGQLLPLNKYTLPLCGEVCLF